MEACGLSYDDMPKRSRTAVATAAAELAALKPPVQPREVLRRASIYVDVFPGAALTPSALVKHWPALSRAKVVRQETPKRLSGLEAAIRRCGEILARHVPVPDRNPDELPNRIVLEE